MRAKVAVLLRIVGYAVRWNPAILFVTALGVLSSAVELFAITALVPLSLLATGQSLPPTSIWLKIPHLLGIAPTMRFYVLLFLGTFLVRALTAGITNILINHVNRRFFAHLSARALESFVGHLRFEDVLRESVGHFVTLAGDEANRAGTMLMSVMKLIPSAVLFLLYSGAIFAQSWQFGVALAAFFGLTGACLAGSFRRSHRLGEKQQAQSRVAGTHFIETLNGLRTVRSFNAEAFAASKYETLMVSYARTNAQIDTLNLLARLLPAAALLAGLMAAVTILTSNAWLAAELPFLFVGAMMVMRVLPVAGVALESGLKLASDLRAAANINQMLKVVEDAEEVSESKLPGVSGPITRIEFDRVNFRFSTDLPPVLVNFSTHFEAGKSYALVGPSGAGKSSLIDLTLKFFAPQSGEVRINGVSVSQISATSIREHAVLVEQTTRIFYDTVLENLALGHSLDRAIAMESLRMAALDEHVSTLPQGIDTMVAYQGSNFSGGQRQRIGLARGLARPADVLILDESTNALDSTVREAVIREILNAYRNRIVIFVTHDPFVMERVDEIIHLTPANQAQKSEAEASS